MNKLPIVFCTVILILASIGCYYWAFQYVESPAVVITAPLSESNTIPIYAQFKLTQSFIVHGDVLATSLNLPLIINRSTDNLIVFDLRQGDKLIQRWRMRTSRIVDQKFSRLLFFEPMRLGGKYELTISATEIDNDHKHEAPLVYFEPNDDSYPDGNYRIASNEKKGDIALSLIQRKTLLAEKWGGDRSGFIAWLLFGLLCLFLLMTLPYSLKKIFD